MPFFLFTPVHFFYIFVLLVPVDSQVSCVIFGNMFKQLQEFPKAALQRFLLWVYQVGRLKKSYGGAKNVGGEGGLLDFEVDVDDIFIFVI